LIQNHQSGCLIMQDLLVTKIACKLFSDMSTKDQATFLMAKHRLYLPKNPKPAFLDLCYHQKIYCPTTDLVAFDFSNHRGYTSEMIFVALVEIFRRHDISDNVGFDFDNCPEVDYMLRLFVRICAHLEIVNHPILADFKINTILADARQLELNHTAIAKFKKTPSTPTKNSEYFRKLVKIYELLRSASQSIAQLNRRNTTLSDDIIDAFEERPN